MIKPRGSRDPVQGKGGGGWGYSIAVLSYIQKGGMRSMSHGCRKTHEAATAKLHAWSVCGKDNTKTLKSASCMAKPCVSSGSVGSKANIKLGQEPGMRRNLR